MTSDSVQAKRWLLVAIGTVFIASVCIMAVEVTAGRIISKKMGSSLYTWTSVIGVVLAGISLGNALGGHVADRFRPMRSLAVLFVLSSLTCVAVPGLNHAVHNWSALWSLNWPTRVACRVAITFLLPATLLGMITPITAKMALDAGYERGRTIGDIYAWVNVGSILGTFLAGFWLIAWIGTMGVIWLVAGVLAALALVYALRSWWAYAWAGALTFLIASGLGPWSWARSAGNALLLREDVDPRIIYHDESQYSYVSVMQYPGKTKKRDLVLDTLVHSTILMTDPDNLQYPYENIYAAITYRYFGQQPNLCTLTVGGGGYCFPRYLAAHWPKGQIDVAEIDPAVTEAAIEAFGLPPDHGLGIYHMDGRNLIESLIRRKRAGQTIRPYDVVYGDAVNDVNVPFHLTTLEYAQKIRELLSPTGMYLINLIDIFESGRFLGAVVNTFNEAFDHVTVIVPKTFGPILDPHVRDTFIVVGSMRPLDLSELGQRSADRVEFGCTVLDDMHLAHLGQRSGGVVLTDDYAPVENLLAPVVLRTSASKKTEIVRRAGELMKAGQYSEAETLFRRALEIDPSSIDTRRNLVQALLRQGENEEATVVLREILEARPNDAFALLRLGRLLVADGQTKEGIDLLDRALEAAPDAADAYFQMGEALAKTNRRQEAIDHYRQAISKNGNHIPTRLRLGTIDLHAGNFEAAAAHARVVLRRAPRNLPARSILGRALAALKRYDEAIEAMKPAVDAPNVPPELLDSLAWVLATCPDGRHRDGTQAVRLAERASQKAGSKNPRFLSTLAAAYAQAGQFDKAVDAAKKTIALAEKSGDTKLLFDIRQRLRQYEKGRPVRDE